MAEDLEGRTLLSVGLDPTFGFGGLAPTIVPQDTTTTSHFETLNSIALQNGQAVEVGTITASPTGASGGASTTQLIVTRLTTAGLPDSTFGSNGTETIPLIFGSSTYTVSSAADIAVQPSGSIDVLGTATPTSSVSGTSGFLVVQLTPNGAVDTTFGTSGAEFVGFGTAASPTSANASGLAIGPDGKIVAVGSTTLSTGAVVFAVARLNTNGTLDTSFNGTGTTTVNFNVGGASGEFDTPNAVVVQPNSAIVVVGSAQLPANSSGVSLDDSAVTRIAANGALDTTFNGTGLLTYSYNLGGSSSDSANDVTLEGTQIVIAGGTQQVSPTSTSSVPLPSDLTVTRLTASGTFDTTFNGSGKYMLALNQAGIAFNTFDSFTSYVKVMPSGELLVGGTASPFNSSSAANGAFLEELTSAGAPDTSYGTNGVAMLSVSAVDSRLLIQTDGKVLFLAGNQTARTTPPAPAAATTAILTTGTGKKAKATGVTITFNTAVNPNLLTSPTLYTIRVANKRKLIKLKKRGSVSYNAATQTLTLTFAGKTAIGAGFQVTVMTGGIIAADGQVLPATPILILPLTT
jgi:uncharacterized delta-60 repeat protein